MTEGNASSPGQPRPVPIPGELFGGYRIIRLLGKGGMGEVYEAEQLTTGRRLALKVMLHALASEQDRKRFLREGRLAASVNHPNVVYIHGSEEIGGVPVIAMELVSGGTLKDLLKRKSPLTVPEAVDAILQIIDGLEAAEQAGVLHRDIKPANCFVAADGTVKVGDFGLSVSTLARGESLLTASGTVLGTPAYASPEQLRGEELDTSSDVYSVGATLYHVLTGRTPFTATDFVKLITEVLDKEPEAPSNLRKDLPPGLGNVVLRALAKDRKGRYNSYAEFREALLPFAARETVPANPARRFLAGVIDDLLAYGPSLLFLVYWSFDPLDMLARQRTLAAFATWLPFYLWYMLYYGISEGLWGAGLGKNLLGLRVVDLCGHRAGVGRATWRAVIFMLPFTLPAFTLMAVMPMAHMRELMARDKGFFTDWAWLPLLLLLYVTMRKRNGYAALNDLGSRTRVIVRPKNQIRPLLLNVSSQLTSELEAAISGSRRFGPYEVKGELWRHDEERLLSGFDPVLRRKIWIHLHPQSSGLSPTARRDLSRPGRLRWLANGTEAGTLWEAYEAVEGEPFLKVASKPQPWVAVRFWLLDLAEELAAMVANTSTAASFGLDRIWISKAGRLLLLDFISPHLAGARMLASENINTPAELQECLVKVAVCALDGAGKIPEPTSGRQFANPEIPLHARGFLEALARGSFEKPEFILGNLNSLISKPAEVSRPRRTASLFFFPSIIFISGLLLGLMLSFSNIRAQRAWDNQFPGHPGFPAAARLYETYLGRAKSGENATEDLALMKGYLAAHYGFLATNDAFWARSDVGLMGDHPQNRKLRRAVSSPVPDDEKLREIEKVIPRRIINHASTERMTSYWVIIGWWLICVALLCLVELFWVLITGEHPVLRLFSLALVDHAGKPASRVRLFGRWALVWVPGGVAGFFSAGLMVLAFMSVQGMEEIFPITPSMVHRMQVSGLLTSLVCGTIWLALIVLAAVNPHRGVHDRLARTWLVAK
jgi:hypothetical protein